MKINPPTTSSAGFVRAGNRIGHWLVRRWRLRPLNRAVLAASRRLFPEAVPAWSMIAEERDGEYVFYVTYRSPGDRSGAHRYFLVRPADLSVSPLQEDYTPARWGPFA